MDRVVDCRVIDVLRVIGTGVGRHEIRLVSWNAQAPTIERRRIIFDHGLKAERPGKIVGMDKDDIALIVSDWPRISQLMGGQP